MSTIEINQVKSLYRQWRKAHGRSEIPMELRQSALRLARRHGDKWTCGELGLGSASLWKWRRAMKNRGRSNKSLPLEVNVSAKPVRFVEIRPTVQAMNTSLGIRIEWQRSDGHRMKVDGVSMDQLGVLARKFLGEPWDDR